MRKCIYNIANLIRKIGFDLNEKNDERVLKMQKEIAKIGKLEFKIEQYPDGSWSAESTNIDGIITGGKSTINMSAEIKDAIFTFFEIPPYLCTDALLKADNEPVTLTQRVYA